MTFSSKYLQIVNCITNMLRELVMQKKEGIKPASGVSENFLEVMPSRTSENAFWDIGQHYAHQ